MSDEDEPTKTVDERLSDELDMDVVALEQQLSFSLDHARMKRGEPSELTYLLIDRQHHQDIAIVYLTKEDADAAMNNSLLVDAVCKEDVHDCYISTATTLEDLKGREIILP